jgi:predicted metal-binding protein
MIETERRKQPYMEAAEYVDAAGRRIGYDWYRRSIAISAFQYGDKFKLLCNGCPKQGRNLSCPPHSPSFATHIEVATQAVVICVRLAQEYFDDLPPKDRYHACFRQASRLLLTILDDYRQEGRPVAGSGPCFACERCSVEEGIEACRNPKGRTYSLESLGVDVIGLLKRSFDLDLEWNSPEKNAPFVCAVGAAFLA